MSKKHIEMLTSVMTIITSVIKTNFKSLLKTTYQIEIYTWVCAIMGKNVKKDALLYTAQKLALLMYNYVISTEKEKQTLISGSRIGTHS